MREKVLRKTINSWNTGACLLILLLMPAATSCDKEDVSSMFDKQECASYLSNKSEYDVTVTFYRYTLPRSYEVKAGKETEIADTERWNMMSHQHIPPEDSVVFAFADEKRIVHRCFVEYDENNKPIVSFEPTENNIFCVEEGNPPSWTMSKVRSKKYRYDYVIGR